MIEQKYFEWIATIIAISGALLNAFQQKEGFYFWLISNLIFIVYEVISIIVII